MDQTFYIYTALKLLLLPLLVLLISDLKKWYSLPPGPIPLPFIGNLLDLPKSGQYLKYQEWPQLYGGIFTIWYGRKPSVIISDPIIAAELLEKRGSKYSSRPRLVIRGEIYYKMTHTSTLPYGKRLAVHRKILNNALKSSSLPIYRPRQEAEASKLAVHILRKPEKWSECLDRFTASVIVSMAYGRRVDSINAEVVRKRLAFMAYGSSISAPGKYLAETFPILAKLPNWLARWKAEVEKKGGEEAMFNMGLVDTVRKDLKKEGKGRGSMTEMMLEMEEKGELQMNDHEFAGVPGTMFNAGSETTATSLRNAILGLVTHPSVFLAAQKEVDGVVGITRSPTFGDKLPYVDALVQETLRWRPVVALGMPHSTSEGDGYGSYYIPKGSTIVASTWAMNLDEEYFPRPHEFAPERFLPEDEGFEEKYKGKEFPNRWGQAGFGWGRRSCPGAELAMGSMVRA